MKTDIHLLWIDDNKDFVDAEKQPLEAWMDGHGFGMNVRFQKTSANVIKLLKGDDIAFIVLDYHLGTKNGDVIIKEVREAGQYQDIIFYSQGLDRNKFKPEDGVFFVDRSDLAHRIRNLLELKIRSASDFATFRGWFLADSIELEILMSRILCKCFGSHESLFRDRVLEHENLFDFYKKHQVLSGILKDRIAKLSGEGKDSKILSLCKKLLDAFPDDIIHPRNSLAHQASEPHESGQKIKTRGKHKEIVLTPENLSGMRKKVRIHNENLTLLDTLV